MSAEASGYVWRHSPHTGRLFLVHLAVADVVNDAHGFEFWMSSDALGAKARIHPGNARTLLAELVNAGDLEIVEAGGGRNRPTRYRFLFPALNGEPRCDDAVSGGEKPRRDNAPNRVKIGQKPRHYNARNSIEPKEEQTKDEPRRDDAVSVAPLVGSPEAVPCSICGVRWNRHRYDCPQITTGEAAS